ncbi:2-oxoglutarate and iron-dependent oxygenase JMJD4 isoform X2 [Benincasa hispida]|uniref:2-oxoglutarate and iron-dependent oxygenase JMJD4 isoform X2 n=2 Tax=Benincasa hispida TaxID=102211 RepID=UPI001901F467|nr:2-oxoglutarate and iron-dependent oxygenase JMJD4 isoform X2 [Benincasa hispida]
MGIEICGRIDKVNGKGLSYKEFVERYMEKNQPVVLTGLMDDWKACSDWVDENRQPNLGFFSTHFGKSRVQVADCSTREFTDQKRVEMSVSEFIDQWCKEPIQEHGLASDHGLTNKSVLYLKDWHFVKEYPNYTAYSTPHFVCDDWLNLYLDSYRMHRDSDSYQEKDEISCSDYRFVYMGAKGSWTPLHADVFRSYSWSANVCGKKQWFLLPPSQSHLVFDRNMKACIYNIFDDISEDLFPGFKKAAWLECTQEQNEIIFVPSGWYHQVHNLDDTVSINHNWFNSYNLCWVLDLMSRDYNEAKEYIEDIRDICDDFEGLCQRNLAANTGMNFYDFFIFLACFSLANLVVLDTLARDTENVAGSSSPMVQQLAQNLASIQKIALKMKFLECFSEDQGFVLDLEETHKDPNFSKLCYSLIQTCGSIHKQQISNFCTKAIATHDSRTSNVIQNFCDGVSSPEDLVKFIDTVLTKHTNLESPE